MTMATSSSKDCPQAKDTIRGYGFEGGKLDEVKVGGKRRVETATFEVDLKPGENNLGDILRPRRLPFRLD